MDSQPKGPSNVKRALISGITGQDGSYLAELLLSKNYEVHGIMRRSSSFNTGRIDHIFDKLKLHHGDMLDGCSLRRAVRESMPDEVYNLAAQSHVGVSFQEPEYTMETIIGGTLRLLEAVREICPKARFYQASSSEMFGNAPAPQNEDTPMHPVSPYGIAKLAAHHLCQSYRAQGMFVACGILFNHESPRRGETFVTRKITRALGKIYFGSQSDLVLGNVAARRDWGFAEEYVEAMWHIMQLRESSNFVIGTGQQFSVGDFLLLALFEASMEPANRIHFNAPQYMRPVEIGELCADASKAKREIAWHPRTTLKKLARIMVQADLKLAEREARDAKG